MIFICESYKDKDRQTDTDRQTDRHRQTDQKTDRQTETQAGLLVQVPDLF